jgi:hypothetical protein
MKGLFPPSLSKSCHLRVEDVRRDHRIHKELAKLSAFLIGREYASSQVIITRGHKEFPRNIDGSLLCDTLPTELECDFRVLWDLCDKTE